MKDYASRRFADTPAWVVVVLALLSLVVITIALTAWIFNWRSDRQPEAKEFAAGIVPRPAPNDFLRGNHFSGMGSSWQGKRFDAATNSGINVFKTANGSNEERYRFRTAIGPGLRNRDIEVLQIDYGLPSNPLWLRQIRDELVQLAPGHYLGKIHLRLPFVTITLGYFRLEAN